jgi:hypothetical protein
MRQGAGIGTKSGPAGRSGRRAGLRCGEISVAGRDGDSDGPAPAALGPGFFLHPHKLAAADFQVLQLAGIVAVDDLETADLDLDEIEQVFDGLL